MPFFEDESPLSGAVNHLDVGCGKVVVAGTKSERKLNDGLNGGVGGGIELVTKWSVRNSIAILQTSKNKKWNYSNIRTSVKGIRGLNATTLIP